jgi:hypothetical protein
LFIVDRSLLRILEPLISYWLCCLLGHPTIGGKIKDEMFPITPPASAQKGASIYTKKLPYCEDVYRDPSGTAAGEHEEGEICESEADWDTEMKMKANVVDRDIFKRFATSKKDAAEERPAEHENPEGEVTDRSEVLDFHMLCKYVRGQVTNT